MHTVCVCGSFVNSRYGTGGGQLSRQMTWAPSVPYCSTWPGPTKCMKLIWSPYLHTMCLEASLSLKAVASLMSGMFVK